MSLHPVGIIRRVHAPLPAGSLRSCQIAPGNFVEPGALIKSCLSPINEKAPFRGFFIYGGEGVCRNTIQRCPAKSI